MPSYRRLRLSYTLRCFDEDAWSKAAVVTERTNVIHPPIPLPLDAVEYIRQIFSDVDEHVTSRLDRMPTVHEESLDFAFIDAVAVAQGPHQTPTGTIVDIDVHFVGGGWHMKRWEVADIGFIVTFRRANELLRTKVVLLQSKRLYPREAEFVEDAGITRQGGLGSLMNPSLPATIGVRTFRFDESCRYKALQVGDGQWQAILQYEKEFKLPVHYMLYHPSGMPCTVNIPVNLPFTAPAPPVVVGTRILAGGHTRTLCEGFPKNYAPSYTDLSDGSGVVGAALPEFVVSGILSCTEGYIVDKSPDQDEGLQRVFYQRNAPIAAAIRLDINLAR